MASARLQVTLTPDERIYLIARLGFLAVFIFMFAVGLPGPTLVGARQMYLVALLIFMASSAVLIWATVERGFPLRRVMMWVLVPDLLVVTAGVAIFHRLDDAFYPVCLLFPIAYALVVSRREAMLAASATAVAYLVGHLPLHEPSLIGYGIYVAKAGAVVLITAMVVGSVAKQRAREQEALAAIAEREATADNLRRRMSELQAVSQITDVIHSTLDFDRIGPGVLDIVAKVIGLASCCLFVIDKEKSETMFQASIGMSAPLGRGASPATLVGGLDSHYSCITIFDHGDALVLFCADSKDIDRLSPDDRLVLGAVASELVVAVENSRLYKLTRKLAITDELTGLSNYRHLQQRLDEEIERSRRYDKHVSMLMLDADDFKLFNDAQGHIAGDAALTELASVLREHVREVDIVARYGGEEFAIILPETDAAGAYVAAEKLRDAVAQFRFLDAEGDRTGMLTVSIGLASYPTHAADKEALLREADDALYRAKNGGKNRVRTPIRAEMNQTESTGV